MAESRRDRVERLRRDGWKLHFVDETGIGEVQLRPPATLTAEQFAMLAEAEHLTMKVFVQSWGLPEPVPADPDDIPSKKFQVILRACLDLAAEVRHPPGTSGRPSPS